VATTILPYNDRLIPKFEIGVNPVKVTDDVDKKKASIKVKLEDFVDMGINSKNVPIIMTPKKDSAIIK
jgi:hypothetical protein